MTERKITLLGGHEAGVWWNNRSKEGEIIYYDPDFLTRIHRHTRQDAVSKASHLAPHVETWLHVLATESA